MQKLIAAFLASFALGLTACDSKPAEQPQRSYFSKMNGLVPGGPLRLIDEDRDGTVDLITDYQDPRWVSWIAEGYTPKGMYVTNNARKLTPEMRTLASDILKAQQEFMYQLRLAEYSR
jgi:hypothetical protein